MVVAAVLLASVAWWFFIRNSNDDSTVVQDTDSETTSTAPTAQSDFTGGTEREPGNTLSENEGSGGIRDNEGNLSDVDTSSSISSESGEITLYTPKGNSKVASGEKVAGESKLSVVSYRIIDNVSGVISTGQLKVVNGKFSGTLEFTTTATEGRLDLFGTKPDGAEYSIIEVPVRF